LLDPFIISDLNLLKEAIADMKTEDHTDRGYNEPASKVFRVLVHKCEQAYHLIQQKDSGSLVSDTNVVGLGNDIWSSFCIAADHNNVQDEQRLALKDRD
jgi:hypothetical protein